MSIELKQYDGSMVTAQDDAITTDLILDDSGIIEGCELTYLGAGQVRISDGRGVIKGRQFIIMEQVINVTLPDVDDVPGRIYIKMDLANTETPIAIRSITQNPLPVLEKDERCNYTNGVYEMELGVYVASVLSINELEFTAKTLRPAKQKILNSLEEVIANTDFDNLVSALAIKKLTGGRITEVVFVNELPADAGEHPTTFYWVGGVQNG